MKYCFCKLSLPHPAVEVVETPEADVPLLAMWHATSRNASRIEVGMAVQKRFTNKDIVDLGC